VRAVDTSIKTPIPEDRKLTKDPESCSFSSKDLESRMSHLEDSVKRLHETATHLVADLREMVRRRIELPLHTARQENARTMKDIERVHELCKLAEAKFETLISRLAGGL